MLTVLLESRAARPRRAGGIVLSALVHGTAIATLVAFTLPGHGSARSAPDIHPTTVTFVRPATVAPSPPRSAAVPHSSPRRPTLPVIAPPVVTPAGIPPIDLTVRPPASDDRILVGERPGALASGTVERDAALGGPGEVSDVSAVDRAPRLLGRALEPRYPTTLRAAGVEGRVVAEFVVDTLGRAELPTLEFRELANPLFGAAVREALARYRFAPGEVAGRKVRTRVAVPFDFRLDR